MDQTTLVTVDIPSWILLMFALIMIVDSILKAYSLYLDKRVEHILN